MSEKTPKRPSQPPGQFSPIILPESPAAAASPQKNLTGLPRVARDLVADLYNSIQHWNDLHIQGANVVKQIANIKYLEANQFNADLEQCTTKLFEIVQKLRSVRNLLEAYVGQVRALEKLQHNSTSNPLFISLPASKIVEYFEEIVGAYKDEFDIKEFVLESIAFSKCKDQAMFFAALWTYQHKIPELVNIKLEALLIETGHRRFS